jgi:glycosyltransferase 2 family protein
VWKTLLKWTLSLGIGAVFVWYAGQNWPLHRVFEGTPAFFGAWFAMVPAAMGDLLADGGAFDAAVRVRLVDAGGWCFNLWWALPYLGFLTLVHFARVTRWSMLLRPIARFKFWELNRIAAVGYMAMFVFPFRLGELVRPYLLRERHKGTIRMTEGLAVIVVERVTDGLLVSMFLFLVLFFMPQEHVESFTRVRLGAYVALFVFVSAIVALALMFGFRERLAAFFERFRLVRETALGQRFLSILRSFLEALQVLPSVGTYLRFTLLTALYWGLVGGAYNVLTMGFELGIPVIGSFAMMATSVVGMMIPNSPANVGSFWVFFLLPLDMIIGATAAGSTQAIAYALFAWGLTLAQYLIFAGYFLLRRSISLDRVMHAHIEE